MANCKLYSITVGTRYRGGGMVIAARSKEGSYRFNSCL